MPGRGLPRSLGTTISTRSSRVISLSPNRKPTRSRHRSRRFQDAAPSTLLHGEFARAPWDCVNPEPNAAPAAAPARAAVRGAKPCAAGECGDLTFSGSWPWGGAYHVTRSTATASAIHLQRGDKGLLRDVDLAELPHLLLAFLLLLQKFTFARDVAAVAFRGDVLAQRPHGLARDHLAADRGLDRNLEHVRRDQLLHLLDHGAAAALGALAVHQHRERIDRLVIDENLHLDEIGRLVVGEMIVERGVALRD